MSLIFTLDSIALDCSMKWTDEFAWTKAVSKSEYSLSGSLLVQSAARLAGRPITIASAEDSGFVGRDVVKALNLLAETPGRQMVLTLPDTRQFNVIFRPGELAVEAREVLPRAVPLDSDYCILTLRLTEI